jgi:hypothetical protein
LAKHEKLAFNNLTKQLGIDSNLASFPSAHTYMRAYPRHICSIEKRWKDIKIIGFYLGVPHISFLEVEVYNIFFSLSGFLM